MVVMLRRARFCLVAVRKAGKRNGNQLSLLHKPLDDPINGRKAHRRQFLQNRLQNL
jgi:hypothetical protein